MFRSKRRGCQRLWGLGEEGFTLTEVLITIVLMGIIFAIATSSWWSLVEARQVDSAANQLASDLRLANAKATNRLQEHAVVTNVASLAIPTPGSSCPDGSAADYYLVEIRTPITASVVHTRCLPERTEIDDPFGARLKTDGSATVVDGLDTTTTVSMDDAGAGAPLHTIDIQPETSRVRVD